MESSIKKVGAVFLILTLFHLFTLSGLDIYRISTRRNYYPKIVSRLFQNKILYSYYLARVQIFSILSFDHVFRAVRYE